MGADPKAARRELLASDAFLTRHLGSGEAAQAEMLEMLACGSVEELLDEVVPKDILVARPIELPGPVGEHEALAELQAIAAQNERWRSFIGQGYYGCRTPAVIQRNVLENPGWYTAYTPYQAEISQGRLEALLAFQQMTIDLTGLPVANASLLDEATAAAEAMALIRRSAGKASSAFFVDAACHPQVLAVMRTRAKWSGVDLVVGDPGRDLKPEAVFGAHLQLPDTYGRIRDPRDTIERVHAAQGLMSLGVDPLALLLLTSPGALGADVAVGSSQRFGVAPGFGGPHAAFMVTREEHKRAMPGRIIGVSKDATGRTALRMALQTREQHIRREKATSNICTSQALLAMMAAFYAIYHGPQGLRRIARRVNFMARLLAAALGGRARNEADAYFDTLVVKPADPIERVRERARAKRINLRWLEDGRAGVSLDETTDLEDVADLAEVLSGTRPDADALAEELSLEPESIPVQLRRSDAVLSHPVFNRYHTETEMMRYLKRLENKDLSLVHAMIPLGSCTMKLNAASELAPISWPQFADLHPFVPSHQARGYAQMTAELERALVAITGLERVSFQPNSGAQGEYAGLLTIRNYQAARGEGGRDVCLIPASAHGTNPASAAMIGMKVVVVACDADGNVDVDDLRRQCAANAGRVAALMITYPSTHGVFEPRVREVCAVVHEAGGQVYMDGANLNALAGIAQPLRIGADVCHINLHKTFAIPHGGGGPGMGPIAVAAHLARHLPGHPCEAQDERGAANGTVSAAPWGSASILPISWMYLRMIGAPGVRRASELAILNANYVAARLAPYFPILYAGNRGRVAHECILDLRNLKEEVGANAEDVAKRLIDYGFHAPTLSFPVADTLMVEPTESESKGELDRFCEAMIAIHGEIGRIRAGEWNRQDNPLHNAPHTAEELAGEWRHPYSREIAAYPVRALRHRKYWAPVKRVDNVAGDRHFVCTLPPGETTA
jgi:glycine dehydrogenase